MRANGAADRTMSDRFIVRSGTGVLVQCLTERLALQKAAELFDRYGPAAEIEIYVNELAPESILYSQKWLLEWNSRRLRATR